MSLEAVLKTRSENQCELCKSTQNLNVYEVPPHGNRMEHDSLWLCEKCIAQLDKKEELDRAHWSVLNESMWSETPAVQVVSWRMLNRLRDESWAADAIDMLYLDDETLAWAKATGDHENSSEVELHRDANGALLADGDNVVLIKTLDVKGSSIRATLGTVVKNIKLVKDNFDQIEGKIDNQTIVILTKYLRKN